MSTVPGELIDANDATIKSCLPVGDINALTLDELESIFYHHSVQHKYKDRILDTTIDSLNRIFDFRDSHYYTRQNVLTAYRTELEHGKKSGMIEANPTGEEFLDIKLKRKFLEYGHHKAGSYVMNLVKRLSEEKNIKKTTEVLWVIGSFKERLFFKKHGYFENNSAEPSKVNKVLMHDGSEASSPQVSIDFTPFNQQTFVITKNGTEINYGLIPAQSISSPHEPWNELQNASPVSEVQQKRDLDIAELSIQRVHKGPTYFILKSRAIDRYCGRKPDDVTRTVPFTKEVLKKVNVMVPSFMEQRMPQKLKLIKNQNMEKHLRDVKFSDVSDINSEWTTIKTHFWDEAVQRDSEQCTRSIPYGPKLHGDKDLQKKCEELFQKQSTGQSVPIEFGKADPLEESELEKEKEARDKCDLDRYNMLHVGADAMHFLKYHPLPHNGEASTSDNCPFEKDAANILARRREEGFTSEKYYDEVKKDTKNKYSDKLKDPSFAHFVFTEPDEKEAFMEAWSRHFLDGELKTTDGRTISLSEVKNELQKQYRAVNRNAEVPISIASDSKVIQQPSFNPKPLSVGDREKLMTQCRAALSIPPKTDLRPPPSTGQVEDAGPSSSQTGILPRSRPSRVSKTIASEAISINLGDNGLQKASPASVRTQPNTSTGTVAVPRFEAPMIRLPVRVKRVPPSRVVQGVKPAQVKASVSTTQTATSTPAAVKPAQKAATETAVASKIPTAEDDNIPLDDEAEIDKILSILSTRKDYNKIIIERQRQITMTFSEEYDDSDDDDELDPNEVLKIKNPEGYKFIKNEDFWLPTDTEHPFLGFPQNAWTVFHNVPVVYKQKNVYCLDASINTVLSIRCQPSVTYSITMETQNRKQPKTDTCARYSIGVQTDTMIVTPEVVVCLDEHPVPYDVTDLEQPLTHDLNEDYLSSEELKESEEPVEIYSSYFDPLGVVGPEFFSTWAGDLANDISLADVDGFCDIEDHRDIPELDHAKHNLTTFHIEEILKKYPSTDNDTIKGMFWMLLANMSFVEGFDQFKTDMPEILARHQCLFLDNEDINKWLELSDTNLSEPIPPTLGGLNFGVSKTQNLSLDPTVRAKQLINAAKASVRAKNTGTSMSKSASSASSAKINIPPVKKTVSATQHNHTAPTKSTKVAENVPEPAEDPAKGKKDAPTSSKNSQRPAKTAPTLANVEQDASSTTKNIQIGLSKMNIAKDKQLASPSRSLGSRKTSQPAKSSKNAKVEPALHNIQQDNKSAVSSSKPTQNSENTSTSKSSLSTEKAAPSKSKPSEACEKASASKPSQTSVTASASKVNVQPVEKVGPSKKSKKCLEKISPPNKNARSSKKISLASNSSHETKKTGTPKAKSAKNTEKVTPSQKNDNSKRPAPRKSELEALLADGVYTPMKKNRRSTSQSSQQQPKEAKELHSPRRSQRLN